MLDEPIQPEKVWRIAYKLARHLDAVDQSPASTWSLKSRELLAELREADPGRFDRECRPRKRRQDGPRPTEGSVTHG